MAQDKYIKAMRISYVVAIYTLFETFVLGGGQGLYPLLCNIFFGITLGCILLGTIFLFLRDDNYSSFIQIFIVFLMLALFWDINVICIRNEQENIFMKFWGLITLNLSCGLCMVKIYKNHLLTINIVKDFFKNNVGIIILILIYSLFFLQNLGLWFLGDDHVYYTAVAEKSNDWDFTLNTLSAFSLGGHSSYAYAFFLTIGEHLWSTLGNGVRLANLLMGWIAIFCFYQILEKIFPFMSKLERCMLSAVFTFAPLFWGISYSVNSDYAMLCFFVFFVYAVVYEKAVYQWIAILAVCFSKEIGIAVLAFFYFGECLYEAIKKQHGIRPFFKSLFSFRRLERYSAVFFFLIYVLLSSDGWIINLRNIFTGANKTDSLPNYVSRFSYVIYKLEELFIMNFHWIIFIFLLIFLVKKCIDRCQKKEKKEFLVFLKENKMLLPLFFAALGFFAISILYFTYLHYRYMQLGLFFYVLLLGAFIYKGINRENIRKVIFIFISVLFVVESYYFIDPVTYQLFPRFNAGNSEIASTRRYFYDGRPDKYGYIEGDEELMADHLMSEGIAYSRIQTQMQPLLEDALKRIDCKSDKLLVLEMSGGWIQNTCRQLFGVIDSEGYYWDDMHQTVTRTPTNIKLNFTHNGADFDIDSYSEVYYFDFPFNKYRIDDFLEKNKIVDHFTEEKGVWKFDVYRVEKRKRK